MGFRCPICTEDFDNDKEALLKHLDQSHEDAGDDWLKFHRDWQKRQERKSKNNERNNELSKN